MKRWGAVLVVAVVLAGTVVLAPNPAGGLATTRIYLPLVVRDSTRVWACLGQENVEQGLYLDYGGDVDTEVVQVGSPPVEARRTGNGAVLPSPDGNTVADSYMQFRADDGVLYAGWPSERVRIEVEYLDDGTDGFMIEYDALSGGPYGDGTFKASGAVVKSGSGDWRVAAFDLCDAYFANRDNGADFRIVDYADGAETVRCVAVTPLAPGPRAIYVDSCGANPWDNLPDSDAIQACIDRACDGDTVVFTSRGGNAGYVGYRIDKTVFLVATTAKRNLTFTSTDPADPALLAATDDLKGFVVHAFARSRVSNAGDIDDLTISHLRIDGNRENRICYGADNVGNGADDNWGSWLPECTVYDDPWCSPGSLNMCGPTDLSDPNQDYAGNPSAWSTGFVVEGLYIEDTECGTALGFCGAAGTIKDTTIDVGGDHVHVSGCAQTDPDEAMGAWSDGITFEGPGHTITGNTIYDVSDVGIVFFGGKDTVITDNYVQARAGNHGMFAAIAVHPWGLGDVSGGEVTGNTVVNTGDLACGGIHAGINIGTHMWGGGCVGWGGAAAVGNANVCTAEPPPPAGAHCIEGDPCQIWGHVAAGETFKLQDNNVTGAQVNYLVEGMDVLGTFVESGNVSTSPLRTDWQNDEACWMGGEVDSWTTIHKAAHHPTLPGWTDQRIHCER